MSIKIREINNICLLDDRDSINHVYAELRVDIKITIG